MQEGFQHGRAFVWEELKGLNVHEDLVFCENLYPDDAPGAEYRLFLHEADVLLWALAREVERGRMAVGEAWRTWEPYRDVLPLIYTDIQKMIFDPARTGWSNESSFPRADEVRRNRPASAIFWYRADVLGITGVGFDMWLTPHPIFEVRGAHALRSLREAAAGKYKIVVKKNLMTTQALPSAFVTQLIS